jgi:3-dehydroquinate synthase
VVERIEVPVSEPYPVIAGRDLDLAECLTGVTEPGNAVIITDSQVGPLHAAGVAEALRESGWNVLDTIEAPAGEESKNLETYSLVLRRIAGSGLTRDGTVFTLGGGVIGDLGGFAAGTYMRGVDFVQLPTSLLAMVDSSVGGKVGVDLPEGKNLVGAFARPRIVLAEIGWLDTLPQREVSCGLAEVIKMGLLSGGEFFEALKLVRAAKTRDKDALQELVSHSVRFKAAVVAEDEFEGGRRAILNYGHTIGHGLEAAAGYGLPHGEAISVGMVAAAQLSRERYGRDLTGMHEDLLHAAGLPARVPKVDVEKVLSVMSRDKKRRTEDTGGGHRFVMLEDIGKPVWGVPVSEGEARAAIEAVVE